MKKLNKILSAVVALSLSVGMVACSGDDGAQGPAGPAGNANVNATTFSVAATDWYRETSKAISYDTLSVPAITANVLANGAVQVYQTFADSLGWNSLPIRFLTFDVNNQVITNANIQSTYNVGEVILSAYSDDRYLFNINDMQIKVVVIPSSAIKSGIDLKDYNAVSKIYGIKEYDL